MSSSIPIYLMSNIFFWQMYLNNRQTDSLLHFDTADPCRVQCRGVTCRCEPLSHKQSAVEKAFRLEEAPPPPADLRPHLALRL